MYNLKRVINDWVFIIYEYPNNAKLIRRYLDIFKYPWELIEHEIKDRMKLIFG